MYSQDLNELTISGRVRSAPQLREFDDGDMACTLVLTHTTDPYGRGNWEIQYYNVSIWGPHARTFHDTFKTDQQIVVTGRLDSIYEPTLTGYQPIVSIIATRIITTGTPADPAASHTAQLQLSEPQPAQNGR